MSDDLKLFPVKSPLRRDGKRFAPGTAVALTVDEAAHLANLGVVGTEPVGAGPESDEVGHPLEDALRAQLAAGSTLDDLRKANVGDIAKATKLKVKRAEIDAALDTIAAEQAATAVIAAIVEALKALGDNVRDDAGEIDRDKVRALQPAGEMPWTDEQIATAATALALTSE